MRIHIIGCSGTGKTYLAKRLSDKYGIPCHDLDELQWNQSANAYGVKTPPAERDRKLQAILEKECWIIEGVYYGWVAESFAKADRIYLLDIPASVYKWRIVRRFILRKLGREAGKKETLRSLMDLLRWTNTFQEKNLPEIRKLLSAYSDKTLIIRSKKQLQDVLS